ncbi:ADP-ribosylglycohydrolase family protein [Phytoactinopolyspora mesophila]|uniref:ADP-ribosylglycohydrolase family protein n=1 Tax=Phytoactinopolyspora mesophila TaxID=2650750 RepID=UPI003CCCECA4
MRSEGHDARSAGRNGRGGALIGLAIGDAAGWPARQHRSHLLPSWTRRLRRELDTFAEAEEVTSLPVPFALNQEPGPLRLGPSDDAEWAAWTLTWLRATDPLTRQAVHDTWREAATSENLPRGRISTATAADALRKGSRPPQTGQHNPHHFDDAAAVRAVAIGAVIADPDRAADVAEWDAEVTNAGDGVYAARAIARMVSLAASWPPVTGSEAERLGNVTPGHEVAAPAEGETRTEGEGLESGGGPSRARAGIGERGRWRSPSPNESAGGDGPPPPSRPAEVVRGERRDGPPAPSSLAGVVRGERRDGPPAPSSLAGVVRGERRDGPPPFSGLAEAAREVLLAELPPETLIGRTTRRALELTRDASSPAEAVPLLDDVVDRVYSYGTAAAQTVAVAAALAGAALRNGTLPIEAVTAAACLPSLADSAPALTGALVGAVVGVDAFPASWVERCRVLAGCCAPPLAGVDILDLAGGSGDLAHDEGKYL